MKKFIPVFLITSSALISMPLKADTWLQSISDITAEQEGYSSAFANGFRDELTNCNVGFSEAGLLDMNSDQICYNVEFTDPDSNKIRWHVAIWPNFYIQTGIEDSDSHQWIYSKEELIDESDSYIKCNNDDAHFVHEYPWGLVESYSHKQVIHPN